MVLIFVAASGGGIESSFPGRASNTVTSSRGHCSEVFGIATLIIHTAGTKNSSVRLEGLAAKTAETLRDTLVSELSSRPQPSGTPVDEGGER